MRLIPPLLHKLFRKHNDLTFTDLLDLKTWSAHLKIKVKIKAFFFCQDCQN